MSDEDFMNASPEALFKEAPSEPSSASEIDVDDDVFEDEPKNNQESIDELDNADDNDDEIEPDTENENSDEDDSDEEVGDGSEDIIDDDDDETDIVDEDDDDTDEPDNSDEEVLNYEELYSELLSPVKANGDLVDIKNVDEARRLMSMGIDYGRKMKELKESRKLLKMLGNHDLLDEAKLNYLIDLDKKNPEAIAKLVQESGIDPLDMNTEESNKYTPSNYSVSESEVQLDDVIDSIRSTPTYADTMKTVSELDDASKRILTQTPQTLAILNEHKANGIYAMVNEEVKRERIFGGLSGLSDLEAYKVVGDRLHAEGKFNTLNQATKPKKVVKTKPAVNPAESALTDKKRKASPIKTSRTKREKPNYDFLNMSDDDFEKFSFDR